MNVKFFGICSLLTALLMGASVNVRAADDMPLKLESGTTTAQGKALEARRLAAQAAILADRAAALADESEAQLDAEADIQFAPQDTRTQRTTSSKSLKRLLTEGNERDVTAAFRAVDSHSRQGSSDAPLRLEGRQTRLELVEEAAYDDELTAALVNSRAARLASRDTADRTVIPASDQEPIPNSNANNRGRINAPVVNNAGYEMGGACCDSSCNTCCDTGCCNAPCLFWVGGVEGTFFKPNFKNDGANVQITDDASSRDYFCSTDNTDLDGLYVAPRIWLGVQGCCWGADVKYWQMRAQDTSYDPSLNPFGQWSGPNCGTPDIGKFAWNGLDLYTIDLEVSRRICLRDDWMQFSMGVRHAEIRHDASITANSDLGGTNLLAYGREDSFSQGTGLVFGWYGRRPVYPCSCVNWYYNLHYSVLWGPTTTSAETAAQINVNDPGSAGSTNLAQTRVSDTLLIGEAQLGLEWNYALRCVPANAFFRAGIEFQSWEGGHGSSSATSFAGTSTTVNNVVTNHTQVTANARANEPSLDLFGFTLGTGLTW